MNRRHHLRLSAGWAVGVAVGAPAAAAEPLPADAAEPWVEVWIDMDLPALAQLPAADRVAAATRIREQQDAVMQQLQALGAVEQSRVQLVRNALAVRMPAAAIPQARHIDGVRGVRPVRHRELLRNP
jgi:hypothetical protein